MPPGGAELDAHRAHGRVLARRGVAERPGEMPPGALERCSADTAARASRQRQEQALDDPPQAVFVHAPDDLPILRLQRLAAAPARVSPQLAERPALDEVQTVLAARPHRTIVRRAAGDGTLRCARPPLRASRGACAARASCGRARAARQEAPGVRRRLGRDLLGRAGGDDQAALLAALGAEVDDPVGGLDHVEVVLDHDHGVAGVDEAVEHLEQPLHVGEVQAGRGLVEDVERAPGRDLRELGRELDALGLAAGERRRGLAEPDVAEPDLVERLQAPADLRDVLEERQRLLDRHVEHVGDGLALEADLERLAVVALAVALLARDVDVREEVHLDLDLAVAAADLAAPALDVEAEASRLVAARPRLLASSRTGRGSRRTGPCRWRGSSAACARSATGRRR